LATPPENGGAGLYTSSLDVFEEKLAEIKKSEIAPKKAIREYR